MNGLDSSQVGNFFTLFLYSPILAFCTLAELHEMSEKMWAMLQDTLHAMEVALLERLLKYADLGMR
jgi:hypothetical protein